MSNGPLREPVGELPVCGPMARTVRDAAALLDVMTGAFPDDLFVAPPLPAGERFLAAAERDPGRLRIGRYRDSFVTGEDLDPEVVAGYEAVSRLLTELGHEVEDIPPPFPAELVPVFETVWSVLGLLTPVEPARVDVLRPLTRWMRERGAAVTGIELANAVSLMRIVSRGAVLATSRFDAVLTPTLAKPPQPVGAIRDDDDPAKDFANQKSFAPFTAAYNMTGQPAVSLPLHWTDDGLPIGMQLVGRPFDEVTLISLAAQLEMARPWHARRPVTW